MKKKIVIAIDSYKGCLTSAQVADAVAEGILEVCPDAEIVKVPVADGGEGTVEAITPKDSLVSVSVSDSLGRPVTAIYGIIGAKPITGANLPVAPISATPNITAPISAMPNITAPTGATPNTIASTPSTPTINITAPISATPAPPNIIAPTGAIPPTGAKPTAIIEVAAACGLALLAKEERNPLITSTKGVGELIMDAIGRGCRKFLIGLGGSATNDGGRGIVELPGLLQAAQGLEFTVACDVDTPFVGPEGTTRIFSPQKGATPEMVETLEQRMREWAQTIKERTGVNVSDIPGAGAAGGIGGALKAFLNAKLCRGVDMVLDSIGFDGIIQGADLVITGEGRSDFQTPKGKTPAGVLERAKKQGIPTILLSGSIQDCPQLREMGFTRLIAATPPDMPLEQALQPEVAKENLRQAAKKT